MSSRTEFTGRVAWPVLLGTTFLIAAGLRIVGLKSGLWYDEIMTLVLSARHPAHQIVSEFPGVNMHPLYSLLAHASIDMFGESAWALRLPACLFGIASVVMTFVLARRLTTPFEAWAASAVIAASYHHIWFSQNARGYTLLGFLTLISTWMLLRAHRRLDYVIYVIACAAGIYTHLTMAFVVVGHAVVMIGGWALGWGPTRQRLLSPLIWAWTSIAVLSAVLYAPYIPSLVALMGVQAPRAAAGVATSGWALSEAVRSVLSGAGVAAALAGGVFAVVGAFSLWRRHALALALLVAPAVVTAAVIVTLHQPLRPRFFFFLSGAAAIFVGRGIGAVVERLTSGPARSRPWVRPAGVTACTFALVALALPALMQNYRLPKQDFDGAVRFLENAEANGALIHAAGPGCLPLDAYYGKHWRCLKTVNDWQSLNQEASRVLVVYTLADYIEDPSLAAKLRLDCPVLHRFVGTLGGGDLIVCEARREGRP